MQRKYEFLVLFVLGMAIVGCVTTHPIPESERKVQLTFELPGYAKDTIYIKSKIWFAESFVSSKSVIEYEDKESGIIIGNGNMFASTPGGAKIHFLMKEEIKDNKIRVTFYNLFFEMPTLSGSTNKVPINTAEGIDGVRPKFQELAQKLVESINKSKKDDNW